jgi:hypothetical protein
MKANELRIGNYFKSKSDEAIYELTYELLAEQFNGKDLGFDDMQPIPLTQDWLIKLGFKKHIIDEPTIKQTRWILDWSYMCATCPLSIYDKGKNSFSSFDSSIRGIIHSEIKHVHQLQNLYFALTGEELTIKTKKL